MKMERRFSSVHQTITFSRRMMLLSGGQAAVGALLLVQEAELEDEQSLVV